MVGLSFSAPTLLLNAGIILVLVSAILGGIIYQQLSRQCTFDENSLSCDYAGYLKYGILGFGFLGLVFVLAGFTLSIIGGLENEPRRLGKK